MSNLPEHFIDTSVARGQIFGTPEYRADLERRIGPGKQYISDYVLMEFRRSFVVSAIRFLQLLDSPTVTSFSSALSVWSHKFKGSEHKAVWSLIAKMMELENVDFSSKGDLGKIKISIVELIKDLDRQFLAKYEAVLRGGADCARGHVKFDINLESYEEDFENFLTNFNNTKLCRKKCSIVKMLIHDKSYEVNTYIRNLDPIKRVAGDDNFVDVALNLQKIQQKHAAATCYMCGFVGDAVIALDCPSRMILHHTDASFNQLFDSLGKKDQHRIHFSEPGFHKYCESQRRLRSGATVDTPATKQ